MGRLPLGGTCHPPAPNRTASLVAQCSAARRCVCTVYNILRDLSWHLLLGCTSCRRVVVSLAAVGSARVLQRRVHTQPAVLNFTYRRFSIMPRAWETAALAAVLLLGSTCMVMAQEPVNVRKHPAL